MRFRYLLPAFACGLAACAVVAPTPTPSAATLDPLRPPLTPTFPATPPPSATVAATTEPIASLGLRGRIVYTQGLDGLWQIDLVTGTQSQLWKLPERGYLAGVGASPDGARLALTYAPPPPQGAPQLGLTDLYLANGDGSNPQPLLEHIEQYESYIYPFWSPDGEWVYFTHYKPQFDEAGVFTRVALTVEKIRAAGPAGEAPEIVVEDAQQASLSADGTTMAYLRFNQASYQISVWRANADGAEARELLPDTAFFAIAGARISPDGATVAFGASGDLQTSQAPAAGLAPARTGSSPTASAGARWLSDVVSDWFGVKVAAAHGPPWEVWEISAQGGEPVRLTTLFTDGPWTAWSPDGKHLAALRPGGVLLLGAGDPVFLGPATGHGEMVWTP